MKAVQMKMAKASDAEIEQAIRFSNELESKVYGKEGYVTDEDLGRWVREHMPPLIRVTFGYSVLVSNACDPKADTLEWRPDIAEFLSSKPEAAA